jgi:biopolymer transport protein ExbB
MSADFNWIETLRTSPIMLALLLCSVVTLGMVLERAIYYHRRRGNPDATLAQVARKLREGDLQQAIWVCGSTPHPMGAVAREVLSCGDANADVVEERLQLALSEQRLQLERNLGIIGTMAGTTPLIGLLGTVWGIMRSFHDIASSGSSAPTVVSAGVAEALLTTAAGLVIAVPALLMYNYFSRAMHVMLTVAENHVRSLRLTKVQGPQDAGAKRRDRAGQADQSPDDVERLRATLQAIPVDMRTSPESR